MIDGYHLYLFIWSGCICVCMLQHLHLFTFYCHVMNMKDMKNMGSVVYQTSVITYITPAQNHDKLV